MSTENVKDHIKMIAAAKTGEVSFAICLGKEVSGAVVQLDKRRSPDVLGREVKAKGETTKILSGKMTIAGREAKFTCADKPPSGVIKQLKAFFKALKLTYVPVLLDANGVGLNDDAEVPGAGSTNNESGGARVAATGDSELETLVRRLAALRTRIGKADPAIASRLGGLLQKAAAMARDDPAGATAEADRISSALDRIESGPRLSVRELAIARLDWQPVRSSADTEIRRLKSAILVQYRNMPQAKSVVDAALKTLDEKIGRLDSQLTVELDAVLNADPADRGQLTAQVKKTLADFTRYVDTDPILQALDENDIVPDLRLVAPIRDSLAKIAGALGI